MLESINENISPDLGDTCHINRSAANTGQLRSLSVLLPPRQSAELAKTILQHLLQGGTYVMILPPPNAISLFLPCLAWFHSTSRLLSCEMLWEGRGLGTSQESLAPHGRELLSPGQALYKSKINACISIAIYSSPTHSCFTLNLNSM